MTNPMAAQNSHGRRIRCVSYGIPWLMLMLVLFAHPVVAKNSDPNSAAVEKEVAYDPYRGVDVDGRIPRIDKAASGREARTVALCTRGPTQARRVLRALPGLELPGSHSSSSTPMSVLDRA